MKLEVKNGFFRYPHGSREILKDISFSAESGDILAILGPNGAGKTTLLRCVMGFLSWGSGKSLLNGDDIKSIPYRKLWQSISYVPQARQASCAYTVEEMVLLGRSSRVGTFSLPSKNDVAAVQCVLEKLGLEALKNRPCSEISGGELQMVLIAKALVSDPGVLILDEPESNLDFKNQLIVLDAMSELAASGMTCIFNTHYPTHALRRSNKALMLGADGEYLSGETRTIVTEENISRFFGVNAVIGDIETEGNIFRDVVPVSVEKRTKQELNDDRRVIAGVCIISKDNTQAEKINELLHEYNSYLVGRMGMPYREAGVYIINVTLDAPVSAIRALTDKLNLIPSLGVKATYAKEVTARE